MFRAWWNNGPEKKTGVPTEEEFTIFMELWSQAQISGVPADWEKVQFYVWANDLNDGNGYVQEQMTFWPMHEGLTPDGIRNIKENVHSFGSCRRV